MKIITLTFNLLLLSFSIQAQQVCKSYIRDDWNASRYTVNQIANDAIVMDSQTKLMWHQCAIGLSGKDCIDGMAEAFSWQQALGVVAVQNTSGFAGFNDWRLPNIKELQTLSARNCYFPALNKTVFPKAPRYFWTSTPSDLTNNESWAMDFQTGYDETQARINLLNVILVRTNN